MSSPGFTPSLIMINHRFDSQAIILVMRQLSSPYVDVHARFVSRKSHHGCRGWFTHLARLLTMVTVPGQLISKYLKQQQSLVFAQSSSRREPSQAWDDHETLQITTNHDWSLQTRLNPTCHKPSLSHYLR